MIETHEFIFGLRIRQSELGARGGVYYIELSEFFLV